MSDKQITLVSPVGHFVFHRSVILSHAKLIRDAVMGQILNPKPNLPRLRNSEDIYSFVQEHLGRTLEGVSFKYHVV